MVVVSWLIAAIEWEARQQKELAMFFLWIGKRYFNYKTIILDLYHIYKLICICIE